MTAELFNDLPFNLAGEVLRSEIDEEGERRLEAENKANERKAQLTIWPADVQAKACAYVTRIKNHNKNAYACEYLMKTLRNEDTRGIKENCSYMAAQSVRLHLATILDV
jgi:hypothetical protein